MLCVDEKCVIEAPMGFCYRFCSMLYAAIAMEAEAGTFCGKLEQDGKITIGPEMKREGGVMKPLEFAVRGCRFVMHFPGRVSDKLDELQKKRRCILGPGAKLSPSCRINNGRERERMRIGANSQVMGILQVLPHGGEIDVGRDCFVGEWSYIWSTASIKIGDRVLISHNVNIHDNNSHSLSAQRRHRQFVDIFSTGHPQKIDDIDCKPILIEDDVWIGFNSTILKGVTIGRGAVVGACSVVTKDVAPYAVVAGCPARTIGQSSP